MTFLDKKKNRLYNGPYQKLNDFIGHIISLKNAVYVSVKFVDGFVQIVR